MRAFGLPLRKTFMVRQSYYTTDSLLFDANNLNNAVLVIYIVQDDVNKR